MPSKFLRVKTVAMAALAMLSIGCVAAAATGLASPAAERAATQQSARTPGGQAGHAQGDAATMLHGASARAAANSSVPGKPADHTAGPDATGAARHGLCQAWFSGQGDDHGRRADSTAFQALAAAAGGADQVPAYCQADPGASAAHGQRPAEAGDDRPVRTSPPTAGPSDDPGQGNGQGGPPTTT